MKRYWYSILLVCSMVVLMLANTAPAVVNGLSTFAKEGSAEETEVLAAVGTTESVTENTTESGLSDSEESNYENEENDAIQEEQKEASSQDGESLGNKSIELTDDFSGVLFIGDSRTVGLSEYGDLGQAEVFATSGMSVFNLFSAEVKMKDQQKKTLEQVFGERQFDTIFFMLGINEMGYEYSAIVKGYQKAVDRVRELQPNTVLVLQANLHVTADKSSKSPVYNNERIEALNQDIRNMAEAGGDHFIDVNEIFDDGNGNMASQYSSDGVHVLGKYYSVWVDWIRQQAAL